MPRATALPRLIIGLSVMAAVLGPRPVAAQQSDSWEATLAPLYIWASRTDGNIATRAGDVPFFMSFGDAVDNLSGTFSLHFEAHKSRVGFFTDVDFIRLSTESSFTRQGPVPLTVTGDADIDNTFFEAGVSYLLSTAADFAVIGGLRTFTVSNSVEFETPNVSVTPIDASRTAVSGFGGFTYRPALSEKFRFLSRADIGGGSGMSWSAMLGVELRPKRWLGLVAGYKGMGIDFGKEEDDEQIRNVDLTYYGPVFGMNLHWGGQ